MNASSKVLIFKKGKSRRQKRSSFWERPAKEELGWGICQSEKICFKLTAETTDRILWSDSLGELVPFDRGSNSKTSSTNLPAGSVCGDG